MERFLARPTLPAGSPRRSERRLAGCRRESPIPDPESRPLNAIVDVEAAARAGWTPLDLAARLSRRRRALPPAAREARCRAAAFLDLASAIVDARAHGRRRRHRQRPRRHRAAGRRRRRARRAGRSRAARSRGASSATRRSSGCRRTRRRRSDAACGEPVELRRHRAGLRRPPRRRPATHAVGSSACARRRRGRPRTRLPLVAIGGITLDTRRDVIAAGAASVAVISDLLSTATRQARVARLPRAALRVMQRLAVPSARIAMYNLRRRPPVELRIAECRFSRRNRSSS